ncbi:MAG: PilN domain-containing protein [Actinomycetota bacterium]
MAVMRRINLLPPELAVRRRARQLIGLMTAIAVALVAIMGIIYGVQRARLASVNNSVTQQNQRNDQLQSEVNALQQFAGKQMDLQAKQTLLTALSKSEILWSSVLEDIALVLPADDWLTSFTGSASPPTVGSAAVGQLTLGGCTLIPSDGDYLDVARFLDAMAKPPSFSDPFLTRAEKQKVTPGAPSGTSQCPVSFSSSVPITPQALRAARGKGRQI